MTYEADPDSDIGGPQPPLQQRQMRQMHGVAAI